MLHCFNVFLRQQPTLYYEIKDNEKPTAKLKKTTATSKKTTARPKKAKNTCSATPQNKTGKLEVDLTVDNVNPTVAGAAGPAAAAPALLVSRNSIPFGPPLPPNMMGMMNMAPNAMGGTVPNTNSGQSGSSQ